MEDEQFMREALAEARLAYDKAEVPIGAVLVHEGKVIARAHNLVESMQNSTAHAEILCISQGSLALGNWRLKDAVLYCTLEPCPMCAGAIIHSRISRLVWGAPDLRCGAHGSWIDVFAEKHPIHQVSAVGGVLAAESAQLMREFFKMRRGGYAEPTGCADRTI